MFDPVIIIVTETITFAIQYWPADADIWWLSTEWTKSRRAWSAVALTPFAADNANCDIPQQITDDHDVQLFISLHKHDS